MSAASDLLDFSKLEDLKELESYTPGFLLQVLQQFQVNFENSLAKTREAIEAQDFSTTHSYAHTMKGTAASAGCSKLMVECKQLMEVSQGQSQSCGALLEQASETYAQTLQAWTEWVHSLGSADGANHK